MLVIILERFQGIRMIEEMGVNTAIAIENLVGQMYLNAGVIKFSMTILFKEKVYIAKNISF